MATLQYPSIDQFISQFEGFGTPQAASINLANNPGALAPGSFATAHGATGFMYAGSQPIATFPDVTTGLSAEDALVAQYAAQGLNIQDLIGKWSPASAPGNSTASTGNYQNFLSSSLGVPGSTPITAAESSYDMAHGITPQTPAQTTPGSTTPGTTSTDPLVRLGTALGNLLAPATTAPSPFSFGRIAAFLLGLIFIGVGLALFKPTQQIIESGTRAARTIATVAE